MTKTQQAFSDLEKCKQDFLQKITNLQEALKGIQHPLLDKLPNQIAAAIKEAKTNSQIK